VIALSKAETCEANLNGNTNGNIRTARNSVTTSGVQDDLQLVVQSKLRQARRHHHHQRARRRLAGEGGAALGGAGQAGAGEPGVHAAARPQQYVDAPGWFDATAKITPELPRKGAGDSINAVRRREARRRRLPAGLRRLPGDDEQQGARSPTTVDQRQLHRHRAHRGRHRLGLRAAATPTTSRADTAKTSGVAIDKALRSMGAKAIEPGKYTVILEPAASVRHPAVHGPSASTRRQADEGRSFSASRAAATRRARRSSTSGVNIWSDPADPRAPTRRGRATAGRARRRCSSRTAW
jgi:hypothetical protein